MKDDKPWFLRSLAPAGYELLGGALVLSAAFCLSALFYATNAIPRTPSNVNDVYIDSLSRGAINRLNHQEWMRAVAECPDAACRNELLKNPQHE